MDTVHSPALPVSELRASLRAKAETGDAEAKETLGRNLLTVPPFAWAEGLDLVVGAAQQGVGAAEHLIACIAASGANGDGANWDAGLAHLQRAAELGYRPAQAELALLARSSPLAAQVGKKKALPSDIWWRLRASINLHALLSIPKPKQVLDSPRVGLIEGFASPALCDWLVKKAGPLLERAYTVDPDTGMAIDDPTRDNRMANFNLAQADLVLLALRARIAAFTGLNIQNMEATAILNYLPGERFLPHYDYLDPSIPGHAGALAAGGQRVLTFLLYLNDSYEGGETDFPHAEYRFKGRKGDALFFWNVDAQGVADARTFHAGLPPSKGEKWLFSQWVRGGATG